MSSSYLKEARHLQLGGQSLLQLLLLLQLVLEGTGQHVGEQLQRHRQQQLHEGDYQKHRQGNQSEDVGAGARQLPLLPPADTGSQASTGEPVSWCMS